MKERDITKLHVFKKGTKSIEATLHQNAFNYSQAVNVACVNHA